MNGLFPKDTLRQSGCCAGNDVGNRVHEIIQEANKFMRHSKRTRLTGEDINNALRVRNVDRISSAMPRVPTDVSFSAHWLVGRRCTTSNTSQSNSTSRLKKNPKWKHAKNTYLKMMIYKLKLDYLLQTMLKLKPLVQQCFYSMEHQFFTKKLHKAMKTQLLPYFIQFICEQIGIHSLLGTLSA
ncbi:unnamed protein product [Rhizophagus irregularis]|nr:unnamed protein product [Rhizophagus irregularis]